MQLGKGCVAPPAGVMQVLSRSPHRASLLPQDGSGSPTLLRMPSRAHAVTCRGGRELPLGKNCPAWLSDRSLNVQIALADRAHANWPAWAWAGCRSMMLDVCRRAHWDANATVISHATENLWPTQVAKMCRPSFDDVRCRSTGEEAVQVDLPSHHRRIETYRVHVVATYLMRKGRQGTLMCATAILKLPTPKTTPTSATAEDSSSLANRRKATVASRRGLYAAQCDSRKFAIGSPAGMTFDTS